MFSGKPTAKKLVAAAQKGDCKQIRRCLKAGFKATELDPDGKPLLHLAVRGDHCKAVTLLLDEGADISALDDAGRTALHLACEMGLPETAELLMAVVCAKDPAGLDVVTSANETALHLAVRSGSRSICRQLVRHGADVSVRNAEHKTALEYAPRDLQALVMRAIEDRTDQAESEYAAACAAAAQGDQPALEKELANGKPVDCANTVGQSLLQLAAGSRHAELVRMLLSRNADVNSRDCFGRTALHLCAVEGADEMTALLLSSGARLLSDAKGSSPLHRAVEWGRTSMVEQFAKDTAADINAPDGLGRSPLQLAARYGKLKTATTLIRLGASVKDADPEGTTPLHEACRSSRVTVAKLLLEHCADVLAGDKQGRSPLHLAVVTRRPGMVEALLARGADPLQKDLAGDGPLHALLRWQKPTPVPMSEGTEKVHKVSEVALHSRAAAVHLETVQQLCSHLTKDDPPPWPIVDTKGASGETPLHIAVRQCHKEAAVSLLAQFFCSTDLADDSGALPLDACKAKDFPTDVAQAVLAAEANRTVPKPKRPLAEELEESIREGNNADIVTLLQTEEEALDPDLGERLLHLAASMGNAGAMEAMLSRRVASVDCKDSAGRTLLHVAAAAGSKPAVNVLLAAGAMADVLDSEGKYPADVCPASLEDILADALAEHATKHLFDALNAKDEDAARACLAAGASLSETDEYGCNALMVACISQMVTIVEEMLNKRPDLVDAMDETCQTALHWAASEGCLPAVLLLLENNADLHGESELQHTALHRAVIKGHDDVALELARRGADVTLEDFSGRSPLALASPELRTALEELAPVSTSDADKSIAGLSPEETTTRLLARLAEGPMEGEEVRQYVENGVDFTAVDEYGASVLIVASIAGQLAAVGVLLDAGADIGTVDPNFQTALHWAAIEGQVEVCKLLAERAADVDAPDVMGQTPLHWAIQKNRSSVVGALLEAGADPLVADSRGVTALASASGPLKETLQNAADTRAAASAQETCGEQKEEEEEEENGLATPEDVAVLDEATRPATEEEDSTLAEGEQIADEDVGLEEGQDNLDAHLSGEDESCHDSLDEVPLPEVSGSCEEALTDTNSMPVLGQEFSPSVEDEVEVSPCVAEAKEGEGSEFHRGNSGAVTPPLDEAPTNDSEAADSLDTTSDLEGDEGAPLPQASQHFDATSPDCVDGADEPDLPSPRLQLSSEENCDDTEGRGVQACPFQETKTTPYNCGISDTENGEATPNMEGPSPTTLADTCTCDDPPRSGEDVTTEDAELERVEAPPDGMDASISMITTDALSRSQSHTSEDEWEVAASPAVEAATHQVPQVDDHEERTAPIPGEQYSFPIDHVAHVGTLAEHSDDGDEEFHSCDDNSSDEESFEGEVTSLDVLEDDRDCGDLEEDTPEDFRDCEDSAKEFSSDAIAECAYDGANFLQDEEEAGNDAADPARALVDRMFAGVEERAEQLIDNALEALMAGDEDASGPSDASVPGTCDTPPPSLPSHLPPPPPSLAVDQPRGRGPLPTPPGPPISLPPPIEDAGEATLGVPTKRQLDHAMRLSLAQLPPALSLLQTQFLPPSEPAPPPPADAAPPAPPPASQ